MTNQLPYIFPNRAVHLDFHTGPWVPDVGGRFNPELFAKTFKDAHVDSVTLFAKCHHGHLYYDTNRAERHPTLSRDLDLMGEQIEALHREGIRAPIYLSVQCDEYAANEHPDWIALQPDMKQVRWSDSVLAAGWQIMDMSSPYQGFFLDQLQEVLDRYAPTDGIFLDMCWDQPSVSKWALEGMNKGGYDPLIEADRLAYAREVSLGYMERVVAMVEKAHEDHAPAGVWFNSRPKTRLKEEQKFLRHVEIECLPTGGWGYAHFPYVARYVRAVTPLPALGMTGRFYKTWGDNSSLKPVTALKYECCQALSQGMSSSVGDLLHPSAAISQAVYDLIGKVYAHMEAAEPYIKGTRTASQIAVIIDPALGDNPSLAAMGAVNALQQLRHQFDVVPPTQELAAYELVIVLEDVRIDKDLKRRISQYLTNGGALILCGAAALDEAGEPALIEQGILAHGESPFSHTFLHAEPPVTAGLADYDYVMYDRGFRMTPAPGSEVLVQIGEPYFERAYNHFSGHSYTPEEKLSEYAGVVKNGRVITFSVPIIEAYGRHASPNYRNLLGNCIALLIPEPLLRAGGPSKLETTVAKSETKTVIHLLSFVTERRAEALDVVEDTLPLIDVPFSVKTEQKPSRVYLAPNERDLAFTYENGYVHTRVTDLDGHVLLVIE